MARRVGVRHGAEWLGRQGAVWFVGVVRGLVWFGRRGMDQKERGILMVYQWKLDNHFPVPAQEAGAEFEKIRKKYGSLTPANIVNSSREEKDVLHNCFEWSDDVAAEKYRETQAATMLRSIQIVSEPAEKSQKEQIVRAYFCMEKDYKPIQVVMNDSDMQKQVLQTALRELISFRRKYESLKEFARLFSCIDEICGQMKIGEGDVA